MQFLQFSGNAFDDGMGIIGKVNYQPLKGLAFGATIFVAT
jgi:hypothetical protein